MERQLISSGAAFEERVGYSRAVRVDDQVWVSGTAPIMPGDADPPTTPYEQAQICLAIIERALREAGATWTTSSARASTSPTPRSSTMSGARTARHSHGRDRRRPASSRSCSIRAGWWRSRRKR